MTWKALAAQISSLPADQQDLPAVVMFMEGPLKASYSPVLGEAGLLMNPKLAEGQPVLYLRPY